MVELPARKREKGHLAGRNKLKAEDGLENYCFTMLNGPQDDKMKELSNTATYPYADDAVTVK